MTDAPGVTHSMAVAVDATATPGGLIAVDAAQAAQVVRLRGDETPLPPARLFRAITPSGALPGAVLPAPQPGARSGTILLTATLGPAAAATPGKHAATTGSAASGLAARLGQVIVTLTVLDRTGSAVQVEYGTLVADGQPHALAVPLGGDKALYPLRVASITLSFGQPLRSLPTLALTLSGLSLSGWTQQITTPDPIDFPPDEVVRARRRADARHRRGGYVRLQPRPRAPHLGEHRRARLGPARPRAAGTASARGPGAGDPGHRYEGLHERQQPAIGSVVPESVDGATVPLQIVAEVVSFPTVTASGGALITDLGSLQEYLAQQTLTPLPVTQWWLATPGGRVPPALTAGVPAGTDITSAAGLTTANTGDPLSAAPQLALLAMAAAAALLAIMGFWVSIAADVRQRRADAALLAALGVTRRRAALQLCLEKLLLSFPSAALGVLLGTLVARLLVPAVTLTPAAQLPTPPALTLYDLSQAIPLALVVAVLPAVTAALAAARRPDPAADLRAAEEA